MLPSGHQIQAINYYTASLPFPEKGLRHSPAQDDAQALDHVGITLLSVSYAEIRIMITDRNAGYAGQWLGEANFVCDFEISLFGVNKEVVGIHDVLTRSLFGDGIPSSSHPRVSLARPTSASLRC